MKPLRVAALLLVLVLVGPFLVYRWSVRGGGPSDRDAADSLAARSAVVPSSSVAPPAPARVPARAPRDRYWLGSPALPAAPDPTWITYQADGFSFRYPKGATVHADTSRDDGEIGLRLSGPMVTLTPADSEAASNIGTHTGDSYRLRFVVIPNPSRRPLRSVVDSIRTDWNRKADEEYAILPPKEKTRGAAFFLMLDMNCGDCQDERYYTAAGIRVVMVQVVHDISIPGERGEQDRLYAAILSTLHVEP